MKLDISYFKELSELIAYNSASTNGAALDRLNKLKSTVLQGESIEIVDGDKTILIKNLDELVYFKNQYKYLSTINLIDRKNNINELEKVNQKLTRIIINKIEINLIEHNLYLSSIDSKGKNTICNFRSVIGHTFNEKVYNANNVIFRLSFQDEIIKAKKIFTNTNGCLFITSIFDTVNGKIISIVACKEIENILP